ncbi:membrane protein insertion efficiency factor YidD [Candidatus Nomurabacteria bacterium RIFCSPHIGHO2_02_FULL_41_18]|uniref:Putative membrane protein insertion efficiency factor n=1 Tax=Candidatus Nomurabacteria bacterium RIFCSPHIGHO2_02_FULL_41_18 TaxID=1801754 RepID=A0A1F6W8J1_9BACT|nr:MAG: membrane protein insertion efficiency factor YidD [Candidatus Nomurabacteria bacterium RIFCSPHIGHO2_01_FULL_41_71]OGI78005.1 MAG: membrane protein insertion efficiency factor YidD [Candidatus Nomurabacteria bacterium RIFCSPHIGHO2_02_FULL_41_18]OGI90284.1 MAG: membrane protein insertion efficiency factor YidD [Candidatus Nomurabacteria bacterium RIFCSPLOWO2_01_FULL_41_52b]OGJ00015.1 MAG: membrane protein insertion efficiency factor YidD [Candidatus Nomurabacteria bacterium RIFCSPLOWO2_02_
MKLKIFFLKLISFYQKNISVFTIRRCVFYPTCSEYAKDAILKYGIAKGVWFASLRILRCHPWQKNRIDPIK